MEKWLVRNTFGIPKQVGDYVWNGLHWLFSPQNAQATPAAAPAPADASQPTLKPTEPTDPSLVATLPGAGAIPKPPTLGHMPAMDYTAYRKALAEAAPTAPTDTESDKLTGILGGLAAGMQGLQGSGGRNTGNLLLNLGMGALGGLASDQASYKKAMQAYNDSVQAYKEKIASGELAISEQQQRAAQTDQETDYKNATLQWEWSKAQLAQQNPKVLSTKNGVVTYSITNPQGQMEIHTLGTGGSLDVPYYDTQAGQLRADVPMSAAYAGIDAHERTGTLYGDEKPGQPATYLIDTKTYKALQTQANKMTQDENAARGSPLPPKDYSRVFHQHLYQLIYSFAQEHFGQKGINELMNAGKTQGTEKSQKGFSQQTADQGTDQTDQTDTGGQ
jgi:hypothetical protein